jgi:hypothetical protein
MQLSLHPDVRLQKLTMGKEKAPLVVIDNFVAKPEQLIEPVAGMNFAPIGQSFPGVRAQAPKPYMQFMFSNLKDMLIDYFNLRGTRLGFSMCHYSVVTTPPEKLTLIQRIPHIDSTGANGLATVHYLFNGDFGGTAFYRHRATGFEYVDESRHQQYFQALENESKDPRFPGCNYINGDTPFFERIAAQDGVFNRILIYRRNSLHSGSIDEKFIPDPNPLTGRLSINSFMDVT